MGADSLMGAIFSYLRNAIGNKQMEIALLGLDNGGKTTLMHSLTGGAPARTVPTVGLDVKEFDIGATKIKCWDIGGQTQFRPEWGRLVLHRVHTTFDGSKDLLNDNHGYTTGCHAILFVVDTTDTERMFLARHELHILLDEYLAKAKSPILVVANKVDVQGHLSEVDLVQA